MSQAPSVLFYSVLNNLIISTSAPVAFWLGNDQRAILMTSSNIINSYKQELSSQVCSRIVTSLLYQISVYSFFLKFNFLNQIISIHHLLAYQLEESSSEFKDLWNDFPCFSIFNVFIGIIVLSQCVLSLLRGL